MPLERRLSASPTASDAEGEQSRPSSLWRAGLSPERRLASAACRSAELRPFSSSKPIINTVIAKHKGSDHAADRIVGDDGLVLKDRIRQLRKDRGLSQVQLAKAAGVTQPAIAMIELGETQSLRGDTLMRLSAALGEDPEYLRTGKRQLRPPTGAGGVAAELFLQLTPSNQTVWMDMGKILQNQQAITDKYVHNVDHGTGGSPKKQSNQDRIAETVLKQLSDILREHGPDALSRALDLAQGATEKPYSGPNRRHKTKA